MTNLEKLNVKDENGNRIFISILGMFEIPDLEKKYIMYGLVNEDENKDTGAVLLGEVVGEGEDMQILGILPEEKDMVVAYYNEISTQLGEDENE
jgi:uncharacterized protein YrzB (UPF0473 family)